MAGKKCTCPSALSITNGISSRVSIGVCVSLKYTRIGNLSDGKNA
jgi:hypothetical protein